MTTSVVSLSRLMKRPTLAGMIDAQGLRQHDEDGRSARPRRPMAWAASIWPARDGLQAAAHVLGHVGGRRRG